MYNQVKSSAKPLMRNGQGVYHLEASLQIQGFDTKGFDIASFEAGRIQALDQMAKHLFRAIRMDDEAVEYHSSPPS